MGELIIISLSSKPNTHEPRYEPSVEIMNNFPYRFGHKYWINHQHMFALETGLYSHQCSTFRMKETIHGHTIADENFTPYVSGDVMWLMTPGLLTAFS